MTADTRTASEIERDIERERSELGNTLDEIQSRFTPEAVVNEVIRNVRAHGSDVGTAVSRSVKQNPVALAVTGVGLAWLMFGRSHDEPAQVDHRYRAPTDPADPIRPRGPVPGGYDPNSAISPPSSASGAHHPSWYRSGTSDDADDPSAFQRAASRTGSALSDAADKSGSALSDASDAVRDGATSAAKGVQNTAQSAAEAISGTARSARDGGRAAFEDAAARAKRLRAQLAEGTEELSAEARDRVIAARERAIEIRDRSAAQARRNLKAGRDSAVGFLEDQPLVAGALALAVGAAIAASLPRTRVEDEAFGEYSDDLVAEAERIFQDERRKAGIVAQAALDEAQSIAREKGEAADESLRGAVEAVESEARNAADRIKSRAEDEAEKQDLGSVKA